MAMPVQFIFQDIAVAGFIIDNGYFNEHRSEVDIKLDFFML
jgi:hypothetical protein